MREALPKLSELLQRARNECLKTPLENTSAVPPGGGRAELRRLPIRECQMARCHSIGRFTHDRFACLGGLPGDMIAWCDRCKKAVCLSCATAERVCRCGPRRH